jgi:hypothetical protein
MVWAPVPLAELGCYPLGLMIGGAPAFDHHTHLCHDMAAALDRPVPPTDADRMRAVLPRRRCLRPHSANSLHPSWHVRQFDQLISTPLDSRRGGLQRYEAGGHPPTGT